MNTPQDPEKVYYEFMRLRKLLNDLRGCMTQDNYKRELSKLYLTYQERMGEELFETFLDAERTAMEVTYANI